MKFYLNTDIILHMTVLQILEASLKFYCSLNRISKVMNLKYVAKYHLPTNKMYQIFQY